MPSSLTWIDHDAASRERSMRILALFQEKESRDELGLGGIRDTFADRLFPGTSTIQTRLRYMLFVAWMYQSLEEKRVSAVDFGRRADSQERDLIDTMRSVTPREPGVFGGRAGRQLKRLPSSVYWAGLHSWGIRVMDLSQGEYHREVGVVYRRRALQNARNKEREKNGDENEGVPEPGTLTWHQNLPCPPASFPQEANFTLTSDEAQFLLDCLRRSHPGSFLTHLAAHCEPADVWAPWEHPDLRTFTEDHQELLKHARLFSTVMHGAALVYNIALAMERSWEAKVEEHQMALQEWAELDIDLEEIRGWSLDRLWKLTVGFGHTVSPATCHFVSKWVDFVRGDPASLGKSLEARDLVKRREMSLKGQRSRFANRRALEQWGGSSGLGFMTYRWTTAKSFLGDLDAALS